ncbi:MAG: SDR family NAD(P)-dependent oxidoreductase, partial [Rhodococcus sp. (in: high G+C Gram-positive bacteria)]
MDLGIDGRAALVTGADSGIGWHTAKMLLAEGVRVVVSDKDQNSLDEAAAKLGAAEGRLFAFAADVTDTDAVENLAARTQQAVGDIDILVQSSGVTGA